MNTKRIALVFIIITTITLAFSGCRKDMGTIPEQPAKTINDLKIDASFNWKTTRDMVLNIQGMKELPLPVSKTFRVTATDQNIVFTQEFLDLRQDYALNFTIPAYLHEVLIIVGSKTDTIPLTGQVLQYKITN